jgi:hypothetical protein
MKSLASITEKDIETIKMALNDSVSDMNMELRNDISGKKRNELMDYKNKYTKVLEKLAKNPSIYVLVDYELDIAASGLNDAIELLDDNLTDDLTEQEKNDILNYKSDCERLVELLAI